MRRMTALVAMGSMLVVPIAGGAESRPCGTRPDGSSRAKALHRYFEQSRERGGRPLRASVVAAPDRDVANLALIEDQGDLVVSRNPFDLEESSLRFRPNPDGGYDLARLQAGRDPAGDPLPVETGAAVLVELPFSFPFFGRVETRAFVHADGSLTFGQAGLGSEPGLADLLAGPPRLAAFFASLDPSRAGAVTARLLPDRAVFDWRDVPGSGQINRNSFQAILYPTGEIDLSFGLMQTHEGVVGLSPGETFEVTAADLSLADPFASKGALAEQFSETEKVDLVSVTRRFYRSHSDLFEQLVIYTTRPLNPSPGTLAFELNVKNEVQGIGLSVDDHAADYGSAGNLRSVVYMDAVDPYLEVDGFEILGHEVGHRWLARLSFLGGGVPSGGLLGRGAVHWSFFLETDASVLEGNDLEDLGGGRFLTVDIARRYSALDQYAMGLRGAAEVPPFFLVESPDDFRPNRGYKASTGPEPGVSFTGVRREVRIEDVIAAMGPRVPAADKAPRLLRQAFILVSDDVAPVTPERLAALSRIRTRFEPWYNEATEGRGTADATLTR